jgi:AbrB family looped-hinge helix DNA binding protein
MSELLSVVTRKGQVTLPAEIRRRWGLKQGDIVTFTVTDDQVQVSPAKASITDFYQAAPGLTPKRSWKEIEAIAHEDHAHESAAEG